LTDLKNDEQVEIKNEEEWKNYLHIKESSKIYLKEF